MSNDRIRSLLFGLPYEYFKLIASKITGSTLSKAGSMASLITDNRIDNVLYALPVTKLRINKLHEPSKLVLTLRVMVDSVD